MLRHQYPGSATAPVHGGLPHLPQRPQQAYLAPQRPQIRRHIGSSSRDPMPSCTCKDRYRRFWGNPVHSAPQVDITHDVPHDHTVGRRACRQRSKRLSMLPYPLPQAPKLIRGQRSAQHTALQGTAQDVPQGDVDLLDALCAERWHHESNIHHLLEPATVFAGNPKVCKPRRCASSTARITLGEFPLVLMARSTSPGRPSPAT